MKKTKPLAFALLAFVVIQQAFATPTNKVHQTKEPALNVNGTPAKIISPYVWAVGRDGQIFYFNKQNHWNTIPGKATDIGVGANGAVWITGKEKVFGGYAIEQWTGSGFKKVIGGAVRIDVDPWGYPWVVNSFDDIYRWENNNWTKMPGKAKDIGIGADGSVWIIGTDAVLGGFGIYKWNGSSFTKIDGGAVRIDVGPDGNPWVVNSDGNIYRRNNNQWQKMPGSATDISVDINGNVWITGTNAGGNTIYRWTKKTNNWSAMGKAGVAVSAGGEPTATEALPGQWKWFTGSTVSIYPDGRVKGTSGDKGFWKKGNTPDTYVITWNNGQYIDKLHLENGKLSGSNQIGTAVSASQIKKAIAPAAIPAPMVQNANKKSQTGAAVLATQTAKTQKPAEKTTAAPQLFNHEIIGQWKWNSGRFVNIYPDGRATNSDGNTGTWTTGDSPDVFVIHWVKGQNTDRLQLKDDKLKGQNQTGAKVSAKKVIVDFKSGKYHVEQHAGKVYTAEWKLQVKKGKITGKSKWDCCPKEHREDPLKGYVNDYTVVIERDCSGTHGTGTCKQKFVGTIMGSKIEGTCTGDGIPGVGHWFLILK